MSFFQRFIGVSVAAAAILLTFSSAAEAHHAMGGNLPETFVQGFISGLAHPVIGVDHLAFIVAVGILAAGVERGVWGIPAFVLGALGGAALHLARIDVPGSEFFIALSVILIGLLVWIRRRMELWKVVSGLGLAGVLHGFAYAESVVGAEGNAITAYLLGFSLIQLCIGGAAFATHKHLMVLGERKATALRSAVGATVSAIGAFFFFTHIVALS